MKLIFNFGSYWKRTFVNNEKNALCLVSKMFILILCCPSIASMPSTTSSLMLLHWSECWHLKTFFWHIWILISNTIAVVISKQFSCLVSKYDGCTAISICLVRISEAGCMLLTVKFVINHDLISLMNILEICCEFVYFKQWLL